MSEDPIPFTPHTHARLSTSTTTSDTALSSVENRTVVADSDFEFDTYALASEIGRLWKVDDPELVVIQYGPKRVADVHRRMLYMSRRQKLKDVRSLDGYFMSILIRGLKKKSDQPESNDRSDDYYEEYLKRQKERGL